MPKYIGKTIVPIKRNPTHLFPTSTFRTIGFSFSLSFFSHFWVVLCCREPTLFLFFVLVCVCRSEDLFQQLKVLPWRSARPWKHLRSATECFAHFWGVWVLFVVHFSSLCNQFPFSHLSPWNLHALLAWAANTQQSRQLFSLAWLTWFCVQFCGFSAWYFLAFVLLVGFHVLGTWVSFLF